MFVVSMKANRGFLVAVAAVGVALAMLLTQCGEANPTAATDTAVTEEVAAEQETRGFPLPKQGETDGTTG